MPNHIKPTREQLKAGMASSLAKLKTVPTTPPAPVTPPAPAAAPVTPPEPVTPPTPPVATPPAPVSPAVVPPVDTPPAPVTPPAPAAAPVTPPEPPKDQATIDWEKKFKESSAEVQVRLFKEKEIEKAEEEAAKLPDPTPEEMKEMYPNFEELDKVTQRLAMDNLLNKKRNEIIKATKDKFKQIEKWYEVVDTFINDPKTLIAHPELEGKTEEFKAFANKATRRDHDFEDILLAFAGDQARNKPAPHTGAMFEVGGGGPSTPPTPKSDKLTIAEGAELKKKDYKKYVQMLKTGKIDTK